MAAEAGFGVVPLEQVRTMDGLTLIKGLMEGRFPAPPISERAAACILAPRLQFQTVPR